MADAIGNFVKRIHLKSKLHAALGAELIDQELGPGMAFDVLKEQRWTAGCAAFTAAALADAVGDFSDLENRVHFHVDSLQLAGALKRSDKVSQVIVGQGIS